MINLFKKIVFVSTFVFSLCAFSNAAFAGADAWLPGNCANSVDPLTGAAMPGMTTCTGTLADIHNQGSDANRYVGFFTWAVGINATSDIIGSPGFGMSFNGKNYSCTANPSPNMIRQWQIIQTGQRVSFSVTFGSSAAAGANNGVCTGISVFTGSAIHPL